MLCLWQHLQNVTNKTESSKQGRTKRRSCFVQPAFHFLSAHSETKNFTGRCCRIRYSEIFKARSYRRNWNYNVRSYSWWNTRKMATRESFSKRKEGHIYTSLFILIQYLYLHCISYSLNNGMNRYLKTANVCL